MYYKNRNRKSLIGFYVAMGICLLAVGIAAVASYSNVNKAPVYKQESSSEESSSSSLVESVEESMPAFPEAKPPESDGASSQKTENSQSSAPSSSSSAPESTAVPSDTEPQEASVPAEEPEPAAEEPAAAPEEIWETWAYPTAFMLPVGGSIIKEFSGDDLVYSETMRDYRTHRGVDISASRGDTVHAVANGVVREVLQDDLLGNIIVIEHGDFEVRYCGLGGTALVHPGDMVKLGEDIGSVLEIPCEIIEQSHVHIEVRQKGVYTDPAALLP